MVRGASALLIIGLAALAVLELLLVPALGLGTSPTAVRAAAALGAAILAAAVIAIGTAADSRFTVIFLGGGLAMFTAAADAIGARAIASLPEALAWAALGIMFARTFDAPSAAVAIPLLVAGLTLAGFAPDRSLLNQVADAGDPLTLELPAFGGGQAIALPVIVATLLGALATWGHTIDVRWPWTAILVVEAATLSAALSIDPVGPMVLAFLAPNLDRAIAAIRSGDAAPKRLQGQDDLPELPAGGEALVGVVNPVELERLRDRDAQRAIAQQRQDVALHRARRRRLLLQRAGPER